MIRNIVVLCISFLWMCNALLAQGEGMHNPVLDEDFPDPTVIRVGNTYYAYATQAKVNGKWVTIQIAVSKDKFHWDIVGDALPQKPTWASHTQDFWAPHVLYDSATKQFVLFYSAESDDTTTGKCLGVAFSDKPTGPFVDKGSPLASGPGFENIDPMAIIDPVSHKKLLYWGSGFKPIRVQELSDDWKSFKPGTTPQPVVWPGKDKTYSILVEGAWVDYYEGKYYLYYSGDNCCGERANYAVMVARADNAFGPFTRLSETTGSGSSAILEKDSMWLAPGHNSLFRDKKGGLWIAYHAVWQDKTKAGAPTGRDKYLKRVMCINPVVYKNGWPVVEKIY